jgi:serine/threonine protein phosphatase PrpC
MQNSSFTIESFGISDIGLSRKKNEDYFLENPESHFYALADGMGGHRAGEVASENAVELISSCFLTNTATNKEDLIKALHEAINTANKKIFSLSREKKELRGMGTTFCCIALKKDFALFSHVGDSRIYRLHDNTLTKLTHDHSLIFDLLKTRHLEEDEPMPSPYKNVITKALGPSSYLEPEVDTCPLNKNDIFLLCSDGLSDFVSEKRIKKTLLEDLPLEEKGKKLITLAKQRKSQDNITLVLIKIS